MSISSFSWGFDPHLRNFVVYFDTSFNKNIKILFSKFKKKIKFLERKIIDNLILYKKSLNLKKNIQFLINDYFSLSSVTNQVDYDVILKNYLLNFDLFFK
jgi:hypothetical protein